MKKKYLLASTPIFLGFIFMISYFIIGSRVELDGTLVEPFLLIPLSYLFVFSGIIALLFVAIIFSFQKEQT
ncbi:group-specific protein [Bacillus cereus]|uniref:Group-specific protein n=1 Tax=Bacillus cereus TaxID=1396 RepID=A0A1S9T7G1_BACCE|nr:DUF3955 domain-containing protein [Bacillus cereus]OOR05852.1 group-specific protein [Bacillus cereus]